MSVRTVPDLLATLEASGLVADADMLALRRWADEKQPGLGQLAQEVIDRNLLTRYQLREVGGGRADRLILGPYQLLDLLGEGGMGQVFHARHTRLGREVAVKLIRPEKLSRSSVVERFRQEIRAVGKLHHPNVVLAFDADEAGGRHYYAMEFVPGSDLARVVADRGPLPQAEAVGYVRQAAEGLQHATDMGLVHRDVKPANLLLTPDGRVKVLDLGLAAVGVSLDADADPLARPGVIVGSPDFMAPEQARDPLGVDCRADVYALGCTLFYLLTGRPPVSGETAEQKIRRHVTDPPASLRGDRPDLPPELDEVVRWMMAKDPAARPASPAAASAALAPFAPSGGSGRFNRPLPEPLAPVLDFDVVADPPAASPAAPPPPKPRRRGVWVYVAGVVAVGLIAGAVLIPRLVRGPSGSSLPPTFTNAIGVKLVRVGDDLYAGATEVSHGQMLAVLGRSPSVWAGKLRDGKRSPADSVSLADAGEFCRKLTEKDARVSGWAYRLPTDAEWDRLAADAPPPAVGGRIDSQVPQPVGSTAASPLGLSEVRGNLWEWTAEGTLRGGSFREPAADRKAGVVGDDVGFRVVYGPHGS